VTGVEDDWILRRVEYSVDCHGGFDDAEVWAKVAAGTRYFAHQELANFSAKTNELLARETVKVSRGGDSL
jgi:hypothetical protein